MSLAEYDAQTDDLGASDHIPEQPGNSNSSRQTLQFREETQRSIRPRLTFFRQVEHWLPDFSLFELLL